MGFRVDRVSGLGFKLRGVGDSGLVAGLRGIVGFRRAALA